MQQLQPPKEPSTHFFLVKLNVASNFLHNVYNQILFLGRPSSEETSVSQSSPQSSN